MISSEVDKVLKWHLAYDKVKTVTEDTTLGSLFTPDTYELGSFLFDVRNEAQVWFTDVVINGFTTVGELSEIVVQKQALEV